MSPLARPVPETSRGWLVAGGGPPRDGLAREGGGAAGADAETAERVAAGVKREAGAKEGGFSCGSAGGYGTGAEGDERQGPSRGRGGHLLRAFQVSSRAHAVGRSRNVDTAVK